MATQITKRNPIKSAFASAAIIICFIIAVLLFIFVMGSGSNFEGGDNNNHPLPGNYLAMIYKGGVIVPILMSMLLMTFVFSIERILTIGQATGSGSVEDFVINIKNALEANKTDEALALCEKQKGSIGNVILSVVEKYKEMQKDTNFDKEQKIAAISKEMDDAIGLEMPMLERNLPVLATLGSVATLVALLGTVLGMIKAFAAMAQAGAPDASALANGISEALINTAIGIGTSAVAIICYNYFTNKIDILKYRIEETGMSIISSFSASNK
jgi:biopolymer transport protein ExbB